MATPEGRSSKAPRAVLLDFDGPVCSVFRRHPAEAAARLLQADPAFLEWGGDLSPRTDDPMQVLVRAADRRAPRELLEHLDDLLAAWEVEAVRSAEPTPGAHELMHELVARGVPVAVVTNNSESCVVPYLARFGLPRVAVHGRRRGRPDLMKPAPLVVRTACDALGVPPQDAAFVGDSVSDVVAGTAAGVLVVGYANKPGKSLALTAAGAACVVTRMADVAPALGAPWTVEP